MFIPIVRINGINFRTYVDDKWDSVFRHTIETEGDWEINKAGFDLMTVLNENQCLSDEKIDYVLKRLIRNLQSNNISNEIKLELFINLGQLSLERVKVFNLHLKDV